MGQFADICGVSCGTGAIMGLMTGFAVGVWVHAKIIQPAFDEIDGISSEAASGITAAIALLGGMEAFMAAGVCAGALAGPIAVGVGTGVACLGAGIMEGASAARERLRNISCPPCPRFSFFGKHQTTQPPRSLEEGNMTQLPNRTNPSADSESITHQPSRQVAAPPAYSDAPPAYSDIDGKEGEFHTLSSSTV